MKAGNGGEKNEFCLPIYGGFYKLLSIDFVLISSRFPCGRREQRFAKRAQKMLVSFVEPKKRQRS